VLTDRLKIFRQRAYGTPPRATLSTPLGTAPEGIPQDHLGINLRDDLFCSCTANRDLNPTGLKRKIFSTFLPNLQMEFITLHNRWGSFKIAWQEFHGGYMWWPTDNQQYDRLVQAEIVADLDGMLLVRQQRPFMHRHPRSMARSQ